MSIDFNHILPSVRMGSLHVSHKDLIKPLPSFWVNDKAVVEPAGFKVLMWFCGLKDCLKNRFSLVTADFDYTDSPPPRRGSYRRYGVFSGVFWDQL